MNFMHFSGNLFNSTACSYRVQEPNPDVSEGLYYRLNYIENGEVAIVFFDSNNNKTHFNKILHVGQVYDPAYSFNDYYFIFTANHDTYPMRFNLDLSYG